MGGDLLWPAAVAAIAGVAVLRWSWSRKVRSFPANAAGWTLLALAVVLGALEAGAWGLAVTSMFAMAAAILLLAAAAAQSPRRRTAATADRRVRMLPEPGESLQLGRRLATFALVVIGGLAASIAFGIGLRAGGLALGWSEADGNAAAFIAVPIAWGLLATIMLMQEQRRAQFTTLGIAALPILPAIIAGS